MKKIIDLGQMIKLLDYNTAALKEIFALNRIHNITANKDILNDIINKAEEINNWNTLLKVFYPKSKKVRVWEEVEYVNMKYNNIIRLVVYRFSHFTYTDNKEPKRVVYYKILKPTVVNNEIK